MTAATDRLGTVVAGRYRVEQLLGEGGMCTVYRGANLALASAVAIKVMGADAARVPELAKRFKREIAVAERLDHPNIVRLWASGALDDGSLFLVMELLEGRTLTELLSRGPLEGSHALSVARQMLRGLGHAHGQGVVHRDVKPDNIMLVARDGKEMVKLVDFGIAADDSATEKLTTTGQAFGTPEYISPEMARGDKVDARADLYQVGVILFEMLTGRRPFESRDRVALLTAHANQRAPSPREVAPDRDIPVSLVAVLDRALRKKADERFPDAESMLAAVDAPAAAPPPPVAAEAPREIAQRTPSPATSGGLSRLFAPRRSRLRSPGTWLIAGLAAAALLLAAWWLRGGLAGS